MRGSSCTGQALPLAEVITRMSRPFHWQQTGTRVCREGQSPRDHRRKEAVGAGWSQKASWKRRELNKILRGEQDLEKTKRAFQVVSEHWNQALICAFTCRVSTCWSFFTALTCRASVQEQVVGFSFLQKVSGWDEKATVPLQLFILYARLDPALRRPGFRPSPAPAFLDSSRTSQHEGDFSCLGGVSSWVK